MGFHLSAPGAEQGKVLQAFSDAISGMQDVELPLHFADNFSNDLGFHLAALHVAMIQLQ